MGLRACEICRVHGRDYDGEMLIVTGKGNKRRLVPVVDPVIRMALTRSETYLFPGRIDGHLSPDYTARLLARALPGGLTGHQLRHRFATTAYRRTHDLLAVGQVLGHSKPETTKRYISVERDPLIAVVQAASRAAV